MPPPCLCILPATPTTNNNTWFWFGFLPSSHLPFSPFGSPPIMYLHLVKALRFSSVPPPAGRGLPAVRRRAALRADGASGSCMPPRTARCALDSPPAAPRTPRARALRRCTRARFTYNHYRSLFFGWFCAQAFIHSFVTDGGRVWRDGGVVRQTWRTATSYHPIYYLQLSPTDYYSPLPDISGW